MVRTPEERFVWLASLKCNSYTLSCNEDSHSNYQTAAQEIESDPDTYAGMDPEVLKRMVDKDTIWKLQIYETTPLGFVLFIGATLDEVVDEAMDYANKS